MANQDIHSKVIRSILEEFEKHLFDREFETWWMGQQIDGFMERVKSGELKYINLLNRNYR